MNDPQDPRKDPLKDDEVALGRVLRALPGGEPSPRVDAAILAAARNATAASPSQAHRRRGLPGWALGTAAAAVLAVGIGLQLQPGRDATPEGVPAEAPASASASHAALEQVEVTGSRLERQATNESDRAPAEAKPLAPQRRLESPAPAASLAPEPPPPPPAPAAPAAQSSPPAEPRGESGPAAARSLADQDRSREAAAAAERELAESSRQHARSAPPLVLPAPQAEAAADADTALPSAFGADDVLPPVDDDSGLAPADWLERIRERIRQGDRAGARASLQRFERVHPDIAVPADLAAFRP